MTLIDLDFIHFYQPPSKGDLASKRLSMASVNDVPIIGVEGYTPTIPRSNGGWGGSLNDYDLIEVLDSTGSSSTDPLDLLSYNPTLNLKITTQSGPHKSQATKIYIALRKNLVNNVLGQWEETGFACKQYNPETGAGQRTQHFTGWTSLVVKIMAMPDLDGGEGVVHGEL